MEALKDIVDFGVIGLLLVLSVWSVAVAVERWLFYRRVDLTQFPNQQLCEMTLTKRLVVNGTKEAGELRYVPFVITLTADGRVFMNEQQVSDDGLRILLTPHPKDSSVVVRADRVTMLERFVEVVDEIRGLGFRQVSLEVARL